MFVRFVRLRVRAGEEARFSEWYRARVIPALSEMQGCIYAGLLTPWRGEDHRSLTIWRNPGAASAYERTGLYHQLLVEAEPMLSSRTEWRVRLGRESAELEDAESREIPPEGFVIDAGDGAANRLGKAFDTAFVRIVSIRVDPDHIGEFVTSWSNRILPALQAQEGFRGGLLAENVDADGSCLSISIWDREEDAARYEMSGAFGQLTDEVKDTFSPVYTWQMTLGAGRDPRDQAPRVSSYQLVLGKRLAPRGE
jgi:heme-degrading monooxygenase HmoA